MNAFATYDREASQLDNPLRFWDEVDEILHVQLGDQETAMPAFVTLKTHLSSFYALCDACYDDHLEQTYNSDYLLARLLESPLLSNTPVEECTCVLTTLAIAATSLPTLALIYDTLLKLGARQAGVFRTSDAAGQLIPRLVHHFWAARYAEEVNEKRSVSEAPPPPSLDAEAVGKEPQNDKEDVTGWSGADWNVKHVRSTSLGDPKRQLAQQRDRHLQIRLREKALELLYEICRSQRLTSTEIRPIDATFVNHLFELVENSRNWQDDTYNYQLIKLIVALNEQFMVSGISAKISKTGARKSTANASNTVLTVLRTRLNASKTFGENVIFMLNRASSRDAEDICMQLLILKLLYLLFTTKETAHYFYTNDLKVLVDIFIRELSDLPDDHESLRHTYLRVFHPLLTNTQLMSYPYKRKQIQSLLVSLTSHGHLRDISSTTQRLIDRCLSAEWCVDLGKVDPLHPSSTARADADVSESKHTFVVQTIAGGPAHLVEADVAVDAEGLTIPVDKDNEPIQGSSAQPADSSDALHTSTSSLQSPTDDSSTLSKISATDPSVAKQDDMALYLTTPKMRMTRVHSMDERSPQQFRDTLSAHEKARVLDGNGGKEGADVLDSEKEQCEAATQRRRGSDTRSPLYAPRSGRIKSATDIPSSAPKRVHSAVDVRNVVNNGDADSENESVCWSGSPTSSWHQSMSDDHKAAAAAVVSLGRSRAGTGSGSISPSSPLRDSLTIDSQTGQPITHFAEATQPVLAVLDVPSLHVQTASGEDPSRAGLMSSSDSGAAKSQSNTTRRPPPAPPTAETGNGKARHMQYRRLGLHPSPSESSLSCPIRTEAHLGGEGSASGRFLHVSSAALQHQDSNTDIASERSASPGHSLDPSRASSPLPPQSGSQVSLGSSNGRRRRPPPPPVDRSTKISRPAHTLAPESSNAHSQSYDHATSSDSRGIREGSEAPALDVNDEPAPLSTSVPKKHLSSYLRHLHLSSEGGYGW